MCWNKEVSIFTFGIISVVSYKLFKRNLGNDRLLAFFILSYGTMQLFESIIWLGIDLNLSMLNKIGSILASLLLYLHPLALVIGMRYDKFYKKYVNNIYYKILFGISVLVLLLGIYNVSYHLLSVNRKHTFISYPHDVNCHLVWDFPENYTLVVIIALFISLFILKENKIFWVAVILYYFLPKLYLKLTNKDSKMHKDKVYNGSYWCWHVAAFSFILYYLNQYLQK